FERTSPPNHSWHHNAQNPTKIELIPRSQHQAPGAVQKSLHPNQEGGFKKLGSGKCGGL
ncbi:HNH endonuclease, partial [Photorhabdus temperata]|nr:HNH endonuclease [Photorhabdus temperata]